MKPTTSRSMLEPTLCLALTLCAACGESRPAPGAPPGASEALTPTPLVHKPEIADWCPEHGVPESVCTRCNGELVAGFQEKGDWCEQHALPESQCVACHPDLKARFEALAPKSGG